MRQMDACQTLWWQSQEGPDNDLECVNRRMLRLEVPGEGGEEDHRGNLWMCVGRTWLAGAT